MEVKPERIYEIAEEPDLIKNVFLKCKTERSMKEPMQRDASPPLGKGEVKTL